MTICFRQGRRLNIEREKFQKKYNREPTVNELAELTGMDAADAAQAINASMPVLSLTYDGDDEGATVDIPVEPPDEEISTAVAVDEVMSELDERDKMLIRLRYYSGLTQTEVAKRLSMTQVQVSRREKAILKQMRSKLL